MIKQQTGANLLKILLILLILGTGGWLVWKIVDNNKQAFDNESSTKQTERKSRFYFENKYRSSIDKGKCLAEYYQQYPENKPENQKSNKIYLAPPCPGVPQ